MALRPSTIVKYAAFIRLLQETCNEGTCTPLQMKELIAQNNTDQRLRAYLVKRQLLKIDPATKSYFIFLSGKDPMILAREAGHEIYKSRQIYKEGAHVPQEIPEGQIITLTRVETQLLSMILEETKHPHLVAFANDFKLKLAS